MQKKKVELLAPAGNPEGFFGAIYAGADAVYLGGCRFGARAYADNFSEEELVSCIRYAHIFGRKVYLTVNTLVKEEEIEDLYGYLAPLYEAGLDGVIIQDIGVFEYIKEYFPDLERHVSTQMTITGKYGASLLKEMGACRIVPARELSLAEIKEMKEATGLEIETFIHGAMCYCYSGQCLFSSILGGRSGNRGRCAQPCRLPYDTALDGAEDKKKTSAGKNGISEKYPLSLKDMCTIEILPELIEAGIDSFKIEGRMKKPEYAAGVTAIYRKYIDLYEQLSPGKKLTIALEDMETLSKLYIRSERQDGYYHKHNGKEMVTLKSPAYSGSDEILIEKIREKYLNKTLKLPVSVFGYFQVGEPASVTMVSGDLSVTVTGDVVQEASKQSLSQENIERQLCKLGESVFYADETQIFVADNVFYSLKGINELRREAVLQLEEAFIKANGFSVHRSAMPYTKDSYDVSDLTDLKSLGEYRDDCVDTNEYFYPCIHISVRTEEQLSAVKDVKHRDLISRIYVDGDLLYNGYECLKVGTAEVIIRLPEILRTRDDAYLEKLYELAINKPEIFCGFSVGCLEAIGFLKAKGYSGKIFTEPGFYLWNRRATRFWKSRNVDGFCLPYELNGREQRLLMQPGISLEKVFWGRIPMMVTANCVARTVDRCQRQCVKAGESASDVVYLTDRYRKQFPVMLNCLHCMNVIYNSVPLALHGEWHKWKQLVHMRLNFTIEGRDETLEIINFFGKIKREGSYLKEYKPPFVEYTTGHEKRGVE